MPAAWVDRIFAHLSAMYGARFADMWRGTDLADVKAMWASKLAGFADTPNAIKLALDSLDARLNKNGEAYPPNLPEFLSMCRDEARRFSPKSSAPPALTYEATPEEIAEANRRINEIGKKPAFDFLGWAKKPASQLSMTAILSAASRGDERFVEILEAHKAEGICDENYRLLKRWCNRSGDWVDAP